jgi:DNA helicase HerA-like ATPase
VKLFGKPMLNIADFMQTVDIVGPHVPSAQAPKVLLEHIELVMRLVRSKGVSVYFVTQNPLDIPDTVLSQLGNRVQHALRAFTPRDQKAVKSAAETMRANPGLDIGTAISELGVGKALVSLIDDKGRPTLTERVFVLPPGSQIGPISPKQRQALLANSIVAAVYEKTVDRESAFEALQGRTQNRMDNNAPVSTTSPAPRLIAQPAYRRHHLPPHRKLNAACLMVWVTCSEAARAAPVPARGSN